MKHAIVAALTVLSLTFCACGPSPQPGEESRNLTPVRDLQITPDHQKLIVSWQPLADVNFAGYNVYIVPEGASLDEAEPVTDSPFPGDTSPEDNRETFEATGLRNGVVYTVWVRAVYPGMIESPPTEQIRTVCGGRGEMQLGVRYDAENDGFSFADNETVRANDAANDLYFVSVGGVDYLASPTRLDGFQRTTAFVVLPYAGTIEEVSAAVMKNKPEPSEERVIVSQGDWVLLRTADGTHTLLNVRQITGSTDDDRLITLFYAYSPLAGRLFF